MFFKNTKSIEALFFLAAASLLVISAAPASAQVTGLTNRPLSEIIMSAIDWLLGIAAGLAILGIIIGGIYYATAAGDEQQMSSAKTIITYAIFGIFIIIISYSIIVTVNNVIG